MVPASLQLKTFIWKIPRLLCQIRQQHRKCVRRFFIAYPATSQGIFYFVVKYCSWVTLLVANDFMAVLSGILFLQGNILYSSTRSPFATPSSLFPSLFLNLVDPMILRLSSNVVYPMVYTLMSNMKNIYVNSFSWCNFCWKKCLEEVLSNLRIL